MPRTERPNWPARFALASGVGGTVAGSDALRGRKGGSGMGNVVFGACAETGSRSRLVGKAMCGLSVKCAVRAGERASRSRRLSFFCFSCGVKREGACVVG
jgi:hypothetical protein